MEITVTTSKPIDFKFGELIITSDDMPEYRVHLSFSVQPDKRFNPSSERRDVRVDRDALMKMTVEDLVKRVVENRI